MEQHVSESISPDRIEKDFRCTVPGVKNFTDIAVFVAKDGTKVYFAALADGYNREITHHTRATHQRVELVLQLVEEAYAKGCFHPTKAILHTDQGSVFTSKIFKALLDKLNILASNSPRAKCTHNGLIEGIFGVTRNEIECLPFYNDETAEDLMRSLDLFVEWFNNERHTSYNDFLPPRLFRLKDQGMLEIPRLEEKCGEWFKSLCPDIAMGNE